MDMTPEENLHQIDGNKTFIVGEQPLDPVVYNEWHKSKKAYLHKLLSGIVLRWFLRIHESYKNDWSAFVYQIRKQFSSQNNAYHAKVDTQVFFKNKTENVRQQVLEVPQLFENIWCNESAATINLKCNEISTRGRNWKTLLIDGKSNIHRLS